MKNVFFCKKKLKIVKKFLNNSAGEINWMFRAGSTQDKNLDESFGFSKFVNVKSDNIVN